MTVPELEASLRVSKAVADDMRKALLKEKVQGAAEEKAVKEMPSVMDHVP